MCVGCDAVLPARVCVFVCMPFCLYVCVFGCMRACVYGRRRAQQDAQQRRAEEGEAERLAFLRRMHAEQREFQAKKKTGRGLEGEEEEEEGVD